MSAISKETVPGTYKTSFTCLYTESGYMLLISPKVNQYLQSKSPKISLLLALQRIDSTACDGNWHICFILKTDIETIFYFIIFFHKLELLDKVETGHCTHWNMGKVFFVCLFVRFFFNFFCCNISASIFPIHINCHNNTKDIKKKPPHLLSFCDCEKFLSEGEFPSCIWFDGSCYCSQVWLSENKSSCNSQLHQYYSWFL